MDNNKGHNEMGEALVLVKQKDRSFASKYMLDESIITTR